MTSDREALLYAVRADPADDTARLVYADFLQENGEEDRAEFIRQQFQAGPTFAEWPRDGGKMPFDDWDDSASTIFASGQLHNSQRRHELGFRWSRGFIDQVSLGSDTFKALGYRLFDLHPIDYVILSDVKPELHPSDPPLDFQFDSERANHPHILVGVDLEVDTLFGARMPMHLWELLDEFTEEDREPDVWPHKTYPTLAHALEAVSRACVLWGRNLHDMPAWKPPYRLI